VLARPFQLVEGARLAELSGDFGRGLGRSQSLFQEGDLLVMQ
jgi:hypothetical protein